MSDTHPSNDSAFVCCEVSSSLCDIELPKRHILDAVEQHHYLESDVFAIQLALEEALTNAVKHGNCCDPNKTVTVRYSVTDERAVIVVRDQGAGFEPGDVPDPTLPDRLPLPNGRGIMLLRAYMDEIEYRDQGRELYMVKRRRPAET